MALTLICRMVIDGEGGGESQIPRGAPGGLGLNGVENVGLVESRRVQNRGLLRLVAKSRGP